MKLSPARHPTYSHSPSGLRGRFACQGASASHSRQSLEGRARHVALLSAGRAGPSEYRPAYHDKARHSGRSIMKRCIGGAPSLWPAGTQEVDKPRDGTKQFARSETDRAVFFRQPTQRTPGDPGISHRKSGAYVILRSIAPRITVSNARFFYEGNLMALPHQRKGTTHPYYLLFEPRGPQNVGFRTIKVCLRHSYHDNQVECRDSRIESLF